MNQLFSANHGGSEEVNLLQYWKVIKRRRKMIAGVVVAASMIAVVATLMMTKMYRAEALIIPVSSKGGGGGLSSLSSQFGGLAQMAGISIPGGVGETEKFMAILKSRTLAENVIIRENLMPVLFEKAWDSKKGTWKSDDPKKQPTMEAAVLAMKALVISTDDKKNKTIKIWGEFKDPQLAARVVNAYVDELQRFINANAFTTAKRNRMFIEGQMEENKKELLEAGKEINEYYTRGRISSTDAKVDVPISRKAGITGQGDDEHVLVAKNDASAENDGASESDAGLSALLMKKEDIDKKIAEARAVEDVPQQVYLSYLMLRRELLGKVNALLTTQYEMAKIEESKEDLAFQVIDKAVPPIMRSKPKRAQICIMSFFAALFVSVFVAFLREYLEKMKAAEAARRRP